jgi:hypothetical protein
MASEVEKETPSRKMIKNKSARRKQQKSCHGNSGQWCSQKNTDIE